MRVDANVIDLAEVTFGERKLSRSRHECQRSLWPNDRSAGTKERGCGYSNVLPILLFSSDGQSFAFFGRGSTWRNDGGAALMEYMNRSQVDVTPPRFHTEARSIGARRPRIVPPARVRES
jgi:hypothetical protein